MILWSDVREKVEKLTEVEKEQHFVVFNNRLDDNFNYAFPLYYIIKIVKLLNEEQASLFLADVKDYAKQQSLFNILKVIEDYNEN